MWNLGFGIAMSFGILAVQAGFSPAAPLPATATATSEVRADGYGALLLNLVDDSSGLPVSVGKAVEEALYDGAVTAGAALCFQRSMEADLSLSLLCGTDLTERPAVHWMGQFRVTPVNAREVIHLTLTLRVEVEGIKKKRRPPTKIVFVQFEAASDPENVEPHEEFLARGVYASLSQLASVREWFWELKRLPGVAVELPSQMELHPLFARRSPEHLPAEQPEPDAVEEAQAVEAESTELVDRLRWEKEEDAIADLVIEEKFREAELRAENLLLEPLPEPVMNRVRFLLEKVEKKLAEQPEQSAVTTPERQPLQFDYTFPVRLARVGVGFGGGSTGKLRLSDVGISFIPRGGEAAQGWSLRWSELGAARRADGVWGIPDPLLIETKGGTQHYLAELSPDGQRYRDGKKLLELIERGRRRSARSGP